MGIISPDPKVPVVRLIALDHQLFAESSAKRGKVLHLKQIDM